MRTTFPRRRIRVIPVLIACLILIGVILLLIFFPYAGAVNYDIVYDGETLSGVILRSEQVVDLSQYEKLVYESITDGQALQAGEKIVTAYKKGYLKTSLDKLRETENTIVAYQNQSVITGYDDRTIVQYDFDISVLIRRMSEETEGNIALYHQLCRTMREREEYIRSAYNTDSNTYLQGLYQDEKSITESLLAWRDELAAPSDGYIGFYCDKSENDLSPLSDFTVQTMKEQIKRGSDVMANAFKYVSSETWYVAVLTDNADHFAPDAVYPLYIGNAENYEPAYLEKIFTEKRGAVLLFRLDDNVEKYLNLYKTVFFVGTRYEGFSVPSRYVKNNTLTLKDETGARQAQAIRILYQDKDKTVFEPVDPVIEGNATFYVGRKVYP